MATYKVPQDVEAEDKLLGPFSLKQMIFIILFFATAWLAFILSRLALPLGALMVPFLIVFGVFGFVQRKDQPVEVYLAALVRFYLKPHRRIWNQEGFDQRVIITAPKIVEIQRYRNITQNEVKNRLGNLANMMDSRGWAAKGLVTTPSDRLVKIHSPKSEMENAISTDIMDEQTKVSKKFDELIERQTNESRLEAIERMHQMQNAASQQLAGTTFKPLLLLSFFIKLSTQCVGVGCFTIINLPLCRTSHLIKETTNHLSSGAQHFKPFCRSNKASNVSDPKDTKCGYDIDYFIHAPFACLSFR